MSSFDQSRGQGFVVDGKAAYGGVGKLVASRRKADVHIFKSGEGTFRAWAMLRSVPFRTRLSIPVTKCPSERQRSGKVAAGESPHSHRQGPWDGQAFF